MFRQEKVGIEKYDLVFGGMDVVKTSKINMLSIIYGLAILLSTAVVTTIVLFFGFVVLFQAAHVVFSIAAATIAVLGYVV